LVNDCGEIYDLDDLLQEHMHASAYLEKIIIHFPKVNAKWLISGRADVLNDADDSIVNDSKIESKEVARSDSFLVGSKKVVKLIEIYSDGTFREILPTNE
jgi:hypothetical protein